MNLITMVPATAKFFEQTRAMRRYIVENGVTEFAVFQKIDDSHDGECARSGSYRRGGEFDECFQVPSSIRPLSAFFAWHFS